MGTGLRRWIADRFGFHEIHDNFLRRRVPKDPWYTGDGMAMTLLFGIQLLTGIILALTYSPAAASAYDSVQYITHTQFLGWFTRGLHYWSGGIWVVLLAYHLFRQILVGGYKSPREGTWLIGVVLLFLVVTMSFLGYTLRWDERSISAVRVALNVFARIPWIGDDVVVLVQGGPELSDLTLTRLYAMHAILGPMLLLILIGYHLYLVVIRGTVSPSEKEQPIHSGQHQKHVYKADAHSPHRGELFYPETQVRLSLIPTLTFITVVALAVLAGPPALYPPANLAERSFPAEEWWLSWYSGLTGALPPGIAPAFHLLFPVVLFLILVSLPFVDRWKSNRGARDRPIAVAVVILCVIALIYFSSLRRRSPWTAWPQGRPPSVPQGAELAANVEQGRVLFAQYGCFNCHAVAGDGPPFAPDLARLRHRYSVDELRQYILSPPAGVPMPAYEGRITEEDLRRIAEFVLVAQTFPRKQ